MLTYPVHYILGIHQLQAYKNNLPTKFTKMLNGNSLPPLTCTSRLHVLSLPICRTFTSTYQYCACRPLYVILRIVQSTRARDVTTYSINSVQRQQHLQQVSCYARNQAICMIHCMPDCRSDFELRKMSTPWRMTTTCRATWSENTNDVSGLHTWGRQRRQHPNTQDGSNRAA